MSDLLQRLRYIVENCDADYAEELSEAADEIERLQAIERRFNSLQPWDRLPPAATDTVWIEPGRSK